MYLVTAAELWTSATGGLETFFSYPLVQYLSTWLDTGIIAVGSIIFFKYILPKLRENEKNKEYIFRV